MNNLYTVAVNPDVLLCLANLSNDEVFTSPRIANQMLDLLPKELFLDANTKFLDPCCKTGIFLREIAKRLDKGLEKTIPNRQERIDHIMHNQLYGIAITELTSLMARRSLYCSKYANGPFSISTFDTIDGNIRFRRVKHTWKNGSCIWCGASQEQYDRDEVLENHAYEIIHILNPEEIWHMKFDVIIGNPPYQLGDSGAFASASPIYHKFVTQAKKLNPRYLSMIIPSRWFAGGKGLDAFRKEMLEDDRMLELHDFPIGADCFPGTRIAGGVCYFLWNREKHGECKVYSHSGDEIVSVMERPLLEKNADTFIRINEAIPILRKVQAFNEPSFSTIVSARKPFGLPSDFINNPAKYDLPPISKEPVKDGITIIGTYKYKTVERYVDRTYPFPTGSGMIGKYKVYVSQVLDNGFDWTKERLNPFLGEPNTACTETFLCIGEYNDRETAENVISYMDTKLFHLLMHLKKVSHHVVAKVYEYVPMQDFSKPWSDEAMYRKYGLTKDEIEFIETHIKDKDSTEGD